MYKLQVIHDFSKVFMIEFYINADYVSAIFQFNTRNNNNDNTIQLLFNLKYKRSPCVKRGTFVAS